MKKQFVGKNVNERAMRRDTNIEILRIITMMSIIAHHFVVNSGLLETICADQFSIKPLVVLCLGAWGKVGINCFVLITGYYMCKTTITLRKIASLFCEWMFYRIIITVTFWLTNYEPFTLKGLLSCIIPITRIDQGFTACFLLYLLLIPFLNILTSVINEKQHIHLLLVLGFLYIFLGTFHRVTMNYVSWYIVLHFIASYIRLYPKKAFENVSLWGKMCVIMVFLSLCSVVISTYFGYRLERFLSYYWLTDSNSLLAVVNGICFFLFFKNLKIRKSIFINTIAASTYGVLCIHANSDIMRRWLWKDTLDVVGHYNSRLFVLFMICSVLAVFFICIFIDFLRRRLLERYFLILFDKHSTKSIEKARKIESTVLLHFGVKE